MDSIKVDGIRIDQIRSIDIRWPMITFGTIYAIRWKDIISYVGLDDMKYKIRTGKIKLDNLS